MNHDSSPHPPWQDWAFMDCLDIIFQPLPEARPGMLANSVSGQVWQAFLAETRDEILLALKEYRTLRQDNGFIPASMQPAREELKRLRRDHIRDMTALYRQSVRTYRNLAG